MQACGKRARTSLNITSVALSTVTEAYIEKYNQHS